MMNRKALLELRRKKLKQPISEETRKEFSSEYKPNRFYLFRRTNGTLGIRVLYANAEEMNKYNGVIEAAMEKSQYDNRYPVILSKKEFALLEKHLTPLPPVVKVEE